MHGRFRGPLRKIAADLPRAHLRAVKAKLLRLLSVLGLILAALASLDLTGITAVLPPEYAGKALAAGLLIAALRDTVLMFGDLADDGKRNNSWHPVVAWLAVPVFLMALPSCVTQTKTTTAPVGTVTVEKITAPSADALNAGVAGAGIIAPIIRGK